MFDKILYIGFIKESKLNIFIVIGFKKWGMIYSIIVVYII